MKIIYNGKKQNIIDALEHVHELFDDSEFWAAIAAKGSFDHSEYTPAQISEFMHNKGEPVTVKLYKSYVRKRKANAYADPARPNSIFYNSRKTRRSVAKMVKTFVHEYVHTADFTEDGDRHSDYAYGSQSAAGKENTASYWIGGLAQRFYENMNDVDESRMLTIADSEILDENS